MARDTYKGVPDNSPSYVQQTSKVEHYYVDGDNGSDSNSGLAWTEARKTLVGIWEVIPRQLNHNTILHLAGEITLDSDGNLNYTPHFTLNPGVKFIIDGSTDKDGNWHVVDDNSGSNYQATSGSTTAVTVTGAGWTTDEWEGKLIEFLDGPAKGLVAGVMSNTSDTLTLAVIRVNPGAAKFKFVLPHARLTGGNLSLRSVTTGSQEAFYITNIRLAGRLYNHASTSLILLANIFVESTSSSSVSCYYETSLQFKGVYYSPSALAVSDLSTVEWTMGLVTAGGVSATSVRAEFSILSSIINGAVNISQGKANSNSNPLSIGSKYKGLVTLTNFESVNCVSSVTYYGPATSFEAGLVLENCNIGYIDAVEINNPSGHAVEVINSSVGLKAIKGKATGGFGVYAHDNSTVLLLEQPTISGTVGTTGQISINGSSDATTWATVWGGTPTIETTTDMVMIKKKG